MKLTNLGKFCSLLAVLHWVAPACTAQSNNRVKPKEPVVIIAGQPVFEDELLPLVQAQLGQLRNQEYEIKNKALENLIQQRLMEAEAVTKGLTTEKLLAQEVDSKVSEPTEAEITAYYLGLKDRINRPFEEVKPQLREALWQAKRQQVRQDYLRRLREKTEVVVLLRPPKVEVTYDPGRLRGDPQAPVMIVEFSEFQCPFCQKAQATIKELLAKYPGQVRLAFRDFPLRQVHPQAQMAAEASRCSGDQGKFWEYHDLLFANPTKLDADSLREHAHQLGLDESQFSSCLSGEKFKAKIDEDLQEGIRAGVTGAPGFFINGVFISGAQPFAVFEKVIEAELATKRFQERKP